MLILFEEIQKGPSLYLFIKNNHPSEQPCYYPLSLIYFKFNFIISFCQ